jgi:hypothetical protein
MTVKPVLFKYVWLIIAMTHITSSVCVVRACAYLILKVVIVKCKKVKGKVVPLRSIEVLGGRGGIAPTLS